MGAPKQKWTHEEEAALRTGVEKYGPGKWRAILRDPILSSCLSSRSNVDLKVCRVFAIALLFVKFVDYLNQTYMTMVSVSRLL